MISSVWVEPIVRFHSNINASLHKELLCQHALPHLCKERVETPIFMQDNAPCYKAKTLLSFKPWYESYRKCVENHRRENSVQKSTKYWWFMGFSERRIGKYHYHLL